MADESLATCTTIWDLFSTAESWHAILAQTLPLRSKQLAKHVTCENTNITLVKQSATGDEKIIYTFAMQTACKMEFFEKQCHFEVQTLVVHKYKFDGEPHKYRFVFALHGTHAHDLYPLQHVKLELDVDWRDRQCMWKMLPEKHQLGYYCMRTTTEYELHLDDLKHNKVPKHTLPFLQSIVIPQDTMQRFVLEAILPIVLGEYSVNAAGYAFAFPASGMKLNTQWKCRAVLDRIRSIHTESIVEGPFMKLHIKSNDYAELSFDGYVHCMRDYIPNCLHCSIPEYFLTQEAHVQLKCVVNAKLETTKAKILQFSYTSATPFAKLVFQPFSLQYIPSNVPKFKSVHKFSPDFIVHLKNALEFVQHVPDAQIVYHTPNAETISLRGMQHSSYNFAFSDNQYLALHFDLDLRLVRLYDNATVCVLAILYDSPVKFAWKQAQHAYKDLLFKFK